MLRFQDLRAWREWQRRQQPLARRVRSRLRPRTQEPLTLRSWGDPSAPGILIAVDDPAPSQLAALVAPAEHLIRAGVRVMVMSDGAPDLPLLESSGPAKTLPEGESPDLEGNGAVLAVGDYLRCGATAAEFARRTDVPFVCVQHGILTPFAPPPPDWAVLAAWSQEDLEFWRGETRTQAGDWASGSQLLWSAAQRRRPPMPPEPTAVFLGQLHGAELPRATTRATVVELRRRIDFIYRPHPGETDVFSRLQHRRWAAKGVKVDATAEFLATGSQVLGIFSTGLLEAAAGGANAFGFCHAPPDWVTELWDRYRIAPWGSIQPTSIEASATEPAADIAARLRDMLS